MAQKRVQVRDLDAPQRIQPAPIQSDTYAPPPKPIKDDNLEKLAASLGFFARNMNALAASQKDDEEKKLREQQLGAWEAWKASRSNAEQLAGIRSGDLPISINGPLSQLIYKRHAQLLGERLGADLDAERERTPWGRDQFDPDAYVREKAQPYIEEASRDYRLMGYFGQQLTSIRQNADTFHKEQRGRIQTAYLETEGREAIKGAILRGIEEGKNAEQIMAGLTAPKGLFHTIGPVKEGGSLDINYARLGELHMDVLDELAGDPRTAAVARDMIKVRRMKRDGSGTLPPYNSIETYRNKLTAIENKALTTLSSAWQDMARTNIREMNIRNLVEGKREWATISQVQERDPFLPHKELEYSPEAQRKDALIEWLKRERAGKTELPQAQIERELGIVMAAGEKHPEIGGVLEKAFQGAVTLQAGAPDGVDNIERGVEALRLYDTMADRNWQYAREHLSADARRFYDLARTLHLFGDRTPQQAVSEAIAVFSSTSNNADPKALARQRDRIEQAVANFKVDPWYQRWFNLRYANPADAENVREQLVPIVEALALAERQDLKELVEKAADHMAAKGVNINGRFVMDGFVKKGDEAIFQALLDKLWNDNKDYFEANGIPNARHLSVQPLTKGKYVVTKWNGGHLYLPTSKERDKDGKPVRMDVPRINAGDIMNLRKTQEEFDMQEARKLPPSYTNPQSPFDIMAP